LKAADHLGACKGHDAQGRYQHNESVMSLHGFSCTFQERASAGSYFGRDQNAAETEAKAPDRVGMTESTAVDGDSAFSVECELAKSHVVTPTAARPTPKEMSDAMYIVFT
jgi:hypothetical protein